MSHNQECFGFSISKLNQYLNFINLTINFIMVVSFSTSVQRTEAEHEEETAQKDYERLMSDSQVFLDDIP